MSVIKVNKIEHTGTTAGGIEVDSSGHVQVDGQQLPTAGPLSNRNLFINGAMQVAQRGTSKTGLTGTSIPTCDRMNWVLNTAGTWTVSQESDGPKGFTKSFKALCTTADASPAAGDYAILQYKVEAQDVQHLNYGTSDALQMTVSFWVKSNKTGNASFAILQTDNSYRQMGNSYTINAANTWEYKTISIPADTSGVINDDNGEGFLIEWWSNSGSTFTGGSHSTTWEANADANRNASNIGVGQAVNDYWQITGIQLEVGEKATPFEHRSYGDELARCQRYFQKFTGQSSGDYALNGGYTYSNGNAFATGINLSCPLRAQPTLGNATTALRVYGQGTNSNISSTQDIGWAENANWVFIGFALATDIGGVAHAGALTNIANNTFTLDSEL